MDDPMTREELRKLAEWIQRQEEALNALPASVPTREFDNALRGLAQLRSDFARKCSPKYLLSLLDSLEKAEAEVRRLRQFIKDTPAAVLT